MTTSTSTVGQVAVLIDFENVGLSSIRWLFDQVSDIGRIIVKRAYADWSAAASKKDHRQQRDQLLELGIEPIHLFHSVSGKNSSDIRLAIDAVELMYLSPVDTFVIVSSDTDFVPLVSKLRAAGKTVIGAGRRATVSRTLVTSCDKYHFLDQSEPSRVATQPASKPQMESLLVRAVKSGIDEQGKVVGSKLHETLQRLDPSFDYRGMGYSTLTRYLEASDELKVTRPTGGAGDVTVELKEVSDELKVTRPTGGAGDVTVELKEVSDELKVTRPTGGAGDVTVELKEVSDPEVWGSTIDAAWSKRAQSPGQSFWGTTAANDAAKVLGVGKLSDSAYRTLQKLLDASPHLNARWVRRQNKIIRR